MNKSIQHQASNLFYRTKTALIKRFSLRADKADDLEIDTLLREGVEMRGTNLWVLMFAIFIASIGLNVNSTAVIIGAMLISPLMGPIMGIGYAVGIDDLVLVRSGLKNLGIATLISLLTSTLYFLASPLHIVQSELLARTSPTIWDVLIALFGGLAGIVAVTRKEKSNVIPGVAIATALMPPLCTAGFGLATANWNYFLGAFYLFTINCVFIAFSSAIIISAFNLPHKRFIDKRTANRKHLFLGILILLTGVPSAYLAYHLVQEEIFKAKATKFAHQHLEFPHSHVIALKIDSQERRVEATLIGDIVPKAVLTQVEKQLSDEGLEGTTLKVYQTGDQRIDIAALKTNLLGDVYNQVQSDIEIKDRAIEQLQNEFHTIKLREDRLIDIPAELKALYPFIESVVISDSPIWIAKTGWTKEKMPQIQIRVSNPLRKSERTSIEKWLKLRLQSESISLHFESGKSK